MWLRLDEHVQKWDAEVRATSKTSQDIAWLAHGILGVFRDRKTKLQSGWHTLAALLDPSSFEDHHDTWMLRDAFAQEVNEEVMSLGKAFEHKEGQFADELDR